MPRRKLIAVAAALAVLAGAGAAHAASTLSTSDRLGDRRYVAAGERAYVVGSEAGGFPATGWHIRGEMGGIWSPPLKLVDGVWFALDGKWTGPATRFTSGSGYIAMDLPAPAGLDARRVEFVPDGRRAVLIGLRLRSTGAQRRVSVTVDAHSELISAYPWGWTAPTAGDFNLPDTASADGRRLLFRDQGRPPVANAEAHDWASLVGARERPVQTATGTAFRGPQDPPVVCPGDGPAPEHCDDSVFGKGAGGELRYRLTVPAGRTRTLWVAVAGSDQGVAAARSEHAAALRDPEAALAAKLAKRRKLAARTRVELPGDPLLAQGIEWSKQNLADSVQLAEDLAARPVAEGKQYPASVGTVPRARFIGAGFPDYPWLFATDGEYTAFAAVAAGQFEPIEDHLRALRDVSVLINGDSGKIVHEVATDGSVYFGTNAEAGNTDETAKFPSALALVWRWTGDDGFRDELYGQAVRGMHYVVDQLDADGDGWPEGLGNVERTGMGEEKLDNSVYTIRGLYDLADLARSKDDGATAAWAESHARSAEAAFEGAWWMPAVPQHADSLDDPGDVQVQQRHWIGVTPMEVELLKAGRAAPGLTTREHGTAALAVRETDCYSGDFGLYHTGAAGCDGGPPGTGEQQVFTLNSAVMAVGEGNYGRLGADQQRRYTSANRRLQLPEPDEQPGAMGEVAPSPAYGRSIDRPFYDRAMVLQAWGNYGTLWPVVHQQLGVRPDLGRGRLEVTPQLPPYEQRIAGRAIRLGGGAIDVFAARGDRAYRTVVDAGAKLSELTLGATLPLEAQVERVLLDGRTVPGRLHETNRGLEVLARVSGDAGGRHTLVVETR
ncbi:MAG: hypothetical protein QOD71_2145 [Thermoleophilaceae bacterium]|nr:hypothetical protein [Thermoleophilaceae bacterium]